MTPDSDRRPPIEKALAALRSGGLVVIPTDTVYGVAALPKGSGGARGGIPALFAAKGRPREKPVPVLGANAEDLSSAGGLDRRAHVLAAAFWPGPLTLVVPRAEGFEADLGGEERETVAVRVPASEVARELLAASGPLAVSSANRSGEEPATTVEQARAALGENVAVYLDGGPCGGVASTVVSLVGEIEVLREGPLGISEIQQVLQKVIE